MHKSTFLLATAVSIIGASSARAQCTSTFNVNSDFLGVCTSQSACDNEAISVLHSCFTDNSVTATMDDFGAVSLTSVATVMTAPPENAFSRVFSRLNDSLLITIPTSYNGVQVDLKVTLILDEPFDFSIPPADPIVYGASVANWTMQRFTPNGSLGGSIFEVSTQSPTGSGDTSWTTSGRPSFVKINAFTGTPTGTSTIPFRSTISVTTLANIGPGNPFNQSTGAISGARLEIDVIDHSTGRIITEASILSDRIAATGGLWTSGARHNYRGCDPIDFNNDTSIFDPQDVDAFLSVYGEGPCVPETATCNDVDFNNDGSAFDPCDIDAFLLMFAEGPCTPCGV